MRTLLFSVAFVVLLLATFVCGILGVRICVAQILYGNPPVGYNLADAVGYIVAAVVAMFGILVLAAVSNWLQSTRHEAFKAAERAALKRAGAPVD